MITVAQALRDAAAGLESVSDTARLDAESLMAGALDLPRSAMLLAAHDTPEPAGFAPLYARRRAGEPVAYILGRQDFYGRSFAVSPHVLIPRADSEAIIEAAVPVCKRGTRILDCGTGSGALLLTMLAECTGSHGVGVDICPHALEVARANTARLSVESATQLLQRDWTRPGWRDGLGVFDLILANPPYVDEAAPLGPGVREHEPGRALFAGEGGLTHYRALIPQLDRLLAPGGTAVFEIGYDQADAVRGLAVEAGFAAELHRDLADRPRGLVLRRRS